MQIFQFFDLESVSRPSPALISLENRIMMNLHLLQYHSFNTFSCILEADTTLTVAAIVIVLAR